MRAQRVLAREFQFYFPDLDNIILVECHEDESVTIRASKNNVPVERKIFFIRKLAAEGFIPDNFQWFSGSPDGSNGILWIKDYSWLKNNNQALKQKSGRFVKGALVAACVLWMVMMRIVMVSNHSATIAKTGTHSPDRTLLATGQPLPELNGEHQSVADSDPARNPPLGTAIVEEHRAKNLNQH